MVFNRNKTQKQIIEDFNFAKELSVLESSWKEVAKDPVVETDEYGACCSKSVINSNTIPNVSNSNSAHEITSVADDEAIAQLLQAEFDLEFDDELRKLEHQRNKSNIAKFFSMNHALNRSFLLFRLENLGVAGKIPTVP